MSILLALASVGYSQTKHFVILHTNDQHGHLLPFSLPERAPKDDQYSTIASRKDIGGITRRAALVKKIKASEKNVYLFDAGDCMDGTPFSTEYHDIADYETMNEVGYDYAVYGNHDFNLSVPEFEALKSHINFPVLLANVVRRGTDSMILPPFTIGNWDGLRVAILGLVTSSAQGYNAAKQAYDVKSPLEVAARLVPQLRKQADLVVLVTHVGVDVDTTIAHRVPGIDLIVGGHSHTRLPHGLQIAVDHPGAGDPESTIVVQDGHYTPELGRLDLDVSTSPTGRWHVASYRENLKLLTSDMPEDPAASKTLARFWEPIRARYETVIGSAAKDLTDYPNEESSNYYLVADASQAAVHTDFDLENGGGVRAPLLKGAVTMYDLVMMDPFTNTIVTADITGRELVRMIAKEFPQPSAGLTYTIMHDATKAGTEAEYTTGNLRVRGKTVVPETVYHISLNSFYAGSTKAVLQNRRDTGIKRLDATRDYVASHSPVRPRRGRIRQVEK